MGIFNCLDLPTDAWFHYLISRNTAMAHFIKKKELNYV